MSKNTRRLAVSLAAMGLVGGAMVAVSGPASAATCGSGHACGYDSNNYGGRELFDTYVSSYEKIDFLNDRLNSVKNNSGYWLCLYDWSGSKGAVPPGRDIPSLTDDNNEMDYIIAKPRWDQC